MSFETTCGLLFEAHNIEYTPLWRSAHTLVILGALGICWTGSSSTIKPQKLATRPDCKSIEQPMSPPDEPEDYTCSICGKKFPNKAQLKNHVIVYHPNSQSGRAEAIVGHFRSVPSEDIGEFEDVDEATVKVLVPIGKAEPSLGFESSSADLHAPRERPEIDDDIEDPDEATVRLLVPARPLPVTEENVKALGPAIDPFSLARGMSELSVDDESMGVGSYLHDRETSPSEMSDVGTTYSADDVDDEAYSDVADAESPFIQLAVSMLITLYNMMLTDFARRYDEAVRTMPVNADTPNQHDSASVSQASFHTGASFASSVRSTRPREDDDEEEDEPERPQQRRKKSKTTSDDNKPLACPFNKSDNMAFGTNSSNTAYHVCSTWNDVKTAYLKQHLLRTHCMSQFSCDRCGLDCKNVAELRKHNRAVQPCEVRELDSQKIVPEVQEQLGLRSRNKTKTDRVGYWNQCYDLIFSEEERTHKNIEPCKSTPSTVACSVVFDRSGLSNTDHD